MDGNKLGNLPDSSSVDLRSEQILTSFANQHPVEKNIRKEISKSLIEGMTLNEVFEYYVDLDPAASALITTDYYLTYGRLEVLANKLSNRLREEGVGPGSLVGIYFNRSDKPIISILAVLKAGAAYVPIDPSYPAERITYILNHTQVSVVLTQSELLQNISTVDQRQCLVFDDYACLQNFSSVRIRNSDTHLSNSDLSYILFTSGTTGRPKGIMVEHKNVVLFSHAFNRVCDIRVSDRVYQGFSLAFDGSVEEMWMAFGSGATLVVGRQELSKLTDECAEFMNQHQVSVFSTVPTFLSLVKSALPHNRLLIVSGEVCPQLLVDRWANGDRRFLNVYGPTETTVNTTVKECQAGKRVTIGKPIDGYETYVLDSSLQQVTNGEKGELFIGGIGVARGYFGQPELTERSYINNPFYNGKNSKRIYKTGDLVELVGEELHFIRRIDNQVKIRGYRIELAEIESILMEHDQVELAAANIYTDNEMRQIAAYVTLQNGTTELNTPDIISMLKNRLPAYMLPNYLDVLTHFPCTASGKMDRNRLPLPTTPLVDLDREIVPPTDIYQTNILTAWKRVFRNNNISIDDNFFTNLRGDSLSAIEMLTDLRSSFGYQLSARDLYNLLTIRELARKISTAKADSVLDDSIESDETPTSKEVFQKMSRWERYTSNILQLLVVLLAYVVAPLPLITLIALAVQVVQGFLPLDIVLWIIGPLIFLGHPLGLLISVALKWIIIGRYRPGRYPLWGFYYFRCWLAAKIQAASGIAVYSGTPIINLYYRLLGMTIGQNTVIDGASFTAVDLISIGDNCAIGSATQALGFRIESGEMIIGGIEIGDNCFVGNHSQLGLNSKMEDGSHLDDLSSLPDNFTAQTGYSYKGSPAIPSTIDLSDFSPKSFAQRSPILMGILHYLAAMFVGVILLIFSLPIVASILTGYFSSGFLGLSLVTLFWAISGTLFFCLYVAGVKAVLMRTTEAGVYRLDDIYYLRKWTVDLLLSISFKALHSLFTTIYLPPWLRLLGAQVGKRAEISTITKLTPDLATIGDESFFADGSMVGGRRFYNGQVAFAENRIGVRSFVGNNAMLPIGESLGDHCLLGVLSTPPKNSQNCTENESEWLGSPSFRLPHRNRVTIFSDSEIYRPTLKLYLQRMIIDGLRVIYPGVVAGVSFVSYSSFLYWAFVNLSLANTILIASALSIMLVLMAAMSVVVLKKVVMGVFCPVKKPLWSLYVWCNELINGAYETVGAPILSPLMGTPFYNWYLRLMGCKIGRHSYIATSLFSEFDLVKIGDYCALNIGVVIQNHLFEDRVMKSSYIDIKDECSVGNMSVVLYDSTIDNQTVVAPLSLVMKGDHLPRQSSWSGIPIIRKG
jgi:non-ribosomal peptide synthetase-like protein